MLLALALSAALATHAVVLKPVANMYSKPDPMADVVSQAIYGTNVTILEQREGWAKVETPDDYSGWMAVASLGTARAGTGHFVEVRSLFANIYREPSVTAHEPLLTVPFETRLETAAAPDDYAGRFVHVQLLDGQLAWVATGDIGVEPLRLALADLPAFSKRFLGLPYLWGGTSTFGYDCSGFVQMLYRRLGVLLPRDAQPQANWNGLVTADRKHLRPGDLLYFGSSDHHITHTGMYLGNGEFISATVHEHPVVRIDHLEDPYWSKLFVAARRLK